MVMQMLFAELNDSNKHPEVTIMTVPNVVTSRKQLDL